MQTAGPLFSIGCATAIASRATCGVRCWHGTLPLSRTANLASDLSSGRDPATKARRAWRQWMKCVGCPLDLQTQNLKSYISHTKELNSKLEHQIRNEHAG